MNTNPAIQALAAAKAAEAAAIAAGESIPQDVYVGIMKQLSPKRMKIPVVAPGAPKRAIRKVRF
jgi:hypothetical protein